MNVACMDCEKPCPCHPDDPELLCEPCWRERWDHKYDHLSGEEAILARQEDEWPLG